MGNKISIMDGKDFNLDCIEGRFAAFEKVPYAVTLRLSQPIAEDGYGIISINGTKLPKGKQFTMNVFKETYCLMVSVGSVVQEYNTEYIMEISGFKGVDGSLFPKTSVKFKTMPRAQRDGSYKEHDKAAIQAAREGMVLLQNKNNVLPLDKNSILNCFGADQYIFRNSATGAGLINPRWQANFHQAIKEHSEFGVNEEVSNLYRSLKNCVPDKEILDRAKAKSDTAIFIISRTSGEFADNRPVPGGYYLTEDEKSMIASVSDTFNKTVAIINTGYPIEMKWVEEYGIDAVLYTGFAGMGAGYALMEILDGRTNPSGKLPDTWSFDYYDHPSAHNFINLPADHKQVGEKEFGVHIYYEEDIYVGYRYFDTFEKKTAFGFGHGLSYTDFDCSYNLAQVDDGKISVDATVVNVGSVSGKEVVQIYVEAPEGKIEKPRRVLCGFEKTKKMAAGEKQTLHLDIDNKVFATYDESKSAFILEAGEYKVWAGTSLEQAKVIGTFMLDKEQEVQKVHAVNRPVEEFTKLSKRNPDVNEDSKIVGLEERIRIHADRPTYKPKALPAYKGKKITFPMLKNDPSLLDSFIAQMSLGELAKMNVCGGANWYLPWQNGAAGKTAVIKKYKIPVMMVSDGNTGLNIKKRNIGFPSSCTIAATFNKELAYTVGKVIAEESKENGIGLNLGPAMNIHRNILNGRHPEYFSEDPYLAGIMAGMHGKGLEENGCGCCYKHMFCNGSDTSRKASQTIASERALREIYFKVFETAIGVHEPSAMMTSYNSVNGIYPAENADILQTLLRDEWKLSGYIMTDWGTYDTVDPVEIVKAGNSWLTEGGGKYVKIIQEAAKAGKIDRAVLENNVKYLVNTMLKWI